MIDEELRKIYAVRVEGDCICVDFLISDTDETHNVRIAELLEIDLNRVFSEHNGRMFPVLVNLTPLHDKISFLSAETRAIYARIMDNPNITRIAIYGTNAFYDVAISFMIQMTRERGKIAVFKSESDARAWLLTPAAGRL